MLILLWFCNVGTFLFFYDLEGVEFVCFIQSAYILLTNLSLFFWCFGFRKKTFIYRFCCFWGFWNTLILYLLYRYCCIGFDFVNCMRLLIEFYLFLILSRCSTINYVRLGHRRLSLLVYCIKPTRTTNQTIIICYLHSTLTRC